MSGDVIINVILVLIGLLGAYAVYKVYKEKKADGKIEGFEILAILLKLNEEVSKILKSISEAKVEGKLDTIEEQRIFVAKKLEYLINETDLIDEEDKKIVIGFGMDKIATLLVKKVK